MDGAPPPVLSFQLWTSRREPSLDRQLRILREIGYGDVQPHHDQYGDPDALRAALDAHGLTARSAHIHHAMLGDAFRGTVASMRKIGTSLVIMPWLPEEQLPDDRAGWRELGRQMDLYARRFADEGLTFVWHNHDREMRPLPDGTVPIRELLGEYLQWEIDLGWTVGANADPEMWLAEYRGRIPAIHLKDTPVPGAANDEGGQTAIGDGTLEWSTLWPACRNSGAELMVAEHDFTADYETFARRSFAFIRGLME